MGKARAYYNERDAYAAAWLRNLIAVGLIAPGDVDERDIRDVRPADLAGYTQCHFFAGIGVWSRALRLAGWPDDRPIWTGSCPCQPFSQAGTGDGFADERHLWPFWHHLIRVCGPDDVLGEQLASDDGLVWLDLVHDDLEGEAYTVGAVDLCAAGVGAPNIRQRLFFMAHTSRIGRRAGWAADSGDVRNIASPGSQLGAGKLANANKGRCSRRAGQVPSRHGRSELATEDHCFAGRLADTNGKRCAAPSSARVHDQEHHAEPCSILGDACGEGLAVGSIAENYGGAVRLQRRVAPAAGPVNGFWGNAQWVWCEDQRWRPVEPGTFPLAHGAAARVGRLRAYGNAINAEAGAEFVRAVRWVMTELQGGGHG
ncbi:DNA cytosine methyltransferase [Azospirillum picis]|uniref:DNA (Cytosine-5)-methyltransferase 1 n=1 Tax=Azospirillum picis TaxID=488438 RepID=A0ABU0MED8_9PROT|nr:DNA cytosine methyltransferase [Azospirillum picis]MBP2297970.1 DNA (cytosine-5)-methyltransferase 1 [Azospirillum picis]MDQ0531808.1 DNA (cytosine-5)-methyltransferase 1 [Azospirillum picis]